MGGSDPAFCNCTTEKENKHERKWAFIGGILAGVAGVFTAAAVAVELEDRKSGNGDAVEESEQPALPENEGR